MPPVVQFVHESLAAQANAKNVREMAAYMRTTQPFYGVQNPVRLPIFKEMCERFSPAGASEYRAAVLSLWNAGLHGDEGEGWPVTIKHKTVLRPRKDSEMSPPEHTGPREMMYASCYFAEKFGEHITPAHLPLYKRMIVEGAWWDIVDWVSDKLVGAVVLNHRGAAAPVIRKWVDDENLWLRRTAIIAQLGHKDQTDEKMLFEFCVRRADETDFFIRKAIGWALRQHARTNPDAVKALLHKHRSKLSPLSIREAGKHIGVKP